MTDPYQEITSLQIQINIMAGKLADKRRWAAAWKQAAKQHRAYANSVDPQLEEAMEEVSNQYWRAETWKKRARKWKRRARAETTVTGKVTGSILGMPVIEAKDWSEFTRVKATLVTDGNIYMFATCPHCGGLRQVVRPGDIRCGECGK